MASKATFEGRDVIINKTWAGTLAAYMEDIPFRNHVGNGAVFETDMIQNMLEPYIKRATYIYDIGAHTGHHTLAYASLNQSASIFSFEPQTPMFKLLEINVHNNPDRNKNIQLYNLAVGNKHEIASMQKDTFGGSAHIGVGGENVSVIRLDDLSPKGCDFMKIDVEGFEYNVLEGAMNTIRKYRPVICFEDNGSSVTNNITDKSAKQLLLDNEYVIHELVYENLLALPLVKSKFRNASGIAP
jgi:FkbM family methyltransferase